ncbi:hypothetical protein AGDE_01526 [Angomonas deanei]|uniref:BTB/POZ domain containing protein, putative n=1 Tax=Angomonas deanei TaxID=59799 RepID=S9VHY8_9TRYP|nr:hypothetical protein AGDE_11881 [Angomonas deanei]EPY42397.1 hypothetical protein AGDE_01526 [Angomonas deanei]CAD2222260.1 BTB/POZ domain containing protein, putative [Angomonas deanei]|eukprot:EPY25326.1 hypothetical protein AGDE_11881 [Angomonas deanei]
MSWWSSKDNGKEPIALTVGGRLYMTTKQVLRPYGDTPLFSPMLAGREKPLDDGSYFVDGDPDLFRYILNYMRYKKLLLPDNFAEWELLEEELQHYQLGGESIDVLHGHYNYQLFMLRRSLPQAVFIHWPKTIIMTDVHSSGGANHMSAGVVRSHLAREVTSESMRVRIVPPISLLEPTADGGCVLYKQKQSNAGLEASVPPSDQSAVGIPLYSLDQLTSVLLNDLHYLVQHFNEKEGKVHLVLSS